MSPLYFFLAIVWISYAFARMEIEIEGAHGWAENLPTHRLSPRHWVSVIFFEGRPVTEYHIWVELLILSLLHTIYVFLPFSVIIELQLLAFFCFMTVLEDFLWFVLNPAFGVQNFRAEKIWWHKDTWLWVAPRGYYTLLVLGAILYTASFYVR